MRPVHAYCFAEGGDFGGSELAVLLHLADAVFEEVPGEQLAANHPHLTPAITPNSECSSPAGEGKIFIVKLYGLRSSGAFCRRYLDSTLTPAP